MNRQIKFEYVGRNKKHSDIVRQILTLDQIQEGREIHTFFSPTNENCEMLAKRQFTGLLDKNGKEIYEGDIVKQYYLTDNFEGKKSDEFILAKVVANGDTFKSAWGGWELLYSAPVSPLAQLWGGVDEIEVIGNIYSNPELLNIKP